MWSERWAADAAVFGLGFFTLAAQALLFRRFFEVFEGHEIGVAAFFTSWLVWVAVGAWIGRLLPARCAPAFDLGALLYAPACVLQTWLLSRARSWAGVEPYELFPFVAMLPAAGLAAAPVSLLTGLLFTLACRAEAHTEGPPGGSVSRVYALEAAGGFAGGAGVTAALAAGLAEETVFLAVCAVLGLLLAARGAVRARPAPAVVLLLLCLGALGSGLDRRWTSAADRSAWRRLLPEASFEGRFTTPQAVYRHGRYGGATVVLARESVEETVPDDAHAADVVALHLAAAPQTRRALVIGPGAFAVARKFLDAPSIREVCWLHPDPAYPARLIACLPPDERPDPARFRTPPDDALRFLEATDDRFDLVVLHLPDATTLAMNRYFTREFYQAVQARLGPGGVAGVRLSGGENYLGGVAGRLGASVLATLGAVFPHVLLKPGDETWLLASADPVDELSPAQLRRRFERGEGSTKIAPPAAVTAQFPPGRAEKQLALYRSGIARDPAGLLLNTATRPRAPLHGLMLALARGGHPRVAEWFAVAAAPLGLSVLFALGLYAALRLLIRSRSRSASPGGTWEATAAVFGAGAGGMVASLFLMFRYQSQFGELFLHAGLVAALFMLGLFAGARAGTRFAGARATVPAAIAGNLLLAFALSRTDLPGGRPFLIALFAAAGFLAGIFVPVAVRRMREAGLDAGATAVRVEAADHLAGATGGLLAGAFVLPALGIAFAPGLLAAMTLVALPLAFQPRAAASRREDRPAGWLRRAGYVLAFCTLAFAFASVALRTEMARLRPDPLLPVARAMAPDRPWAAGEAGAVRHVKSEGEPVEYVFSTTGPGDEIIGFAGPITLAVRVDAKGAILDVRVLRSWETPSYFSRLNRWWRKLNGLPVSDPQALMRVDTVTGATYSSRTVLQVLARVGPLFARDVLRIEAGGAEAVPRARVERNALSLAVLLAVALAARFAPSRWRRRIWLAAVVAAAGVWLNLQYSLFNAQALFVWPWPPPSMTAAFALSLGLPLAVLLLGNVYCGHACPFGALQELLGDLASARMGLDPPPWAMRIGRAVKYVLLFAFLALCAVGPRIGWSDADPLTTVFADVREYRVPLFAALLLGVSLFYRRFWCRALCPAGALLALLNTVQPLRRLFPRVAPGKCDLGVERQGEADCLLCDRCRMPRTDGARRAEGPDRRARRAAAGAWKGAAYLALVFGAAAWLGAGAVRIARTAAAEAVAEGAPPATAAGGRRPAIQGDEQTARRVRQLQQQGRLSDHEASYYRRRRRGDRDE